MSKRQLKAIDLDRLHEAMETIVHGKFRYRATGLTTAYLHLLLGQIQLGYGDLCMLYVTDTAENAKRASHTLKKMLHDSGFKAPIIPFEFDSGLRIQFGSIDSLKSTLCGNQYDRIFLDLDDVTVGQLKSVGKLRNIMTELRISLMPDGDVI